MIAGVRRVVADRAGGADRRADRVRRCAVEAGDIVDDELARVEQLLAACDRPSLRIFGMFPGPEEGEDDRIEASGRGLAGAGHDREHVQRIVDADAERLG